MRGKCYFVNLVVGHACEGDQEHGSDRMYEKLYVPKSTLISFKWFGHETAWPDMNLKQGRIHDYPVAGDWAGAVMPKK